MPIAFEMKVFKAKKNEASMTNTKGFPLISIMVELTNFFKRSQTFYRFSHV